jgi:hypothetical protein
MIESLQLESIPREGRSYPTLTSTSDAIARSGKQLAIIAAQSLLQALANLIVPGAAAHNPLQTTEPRNQTAFIDTITSVIITTTF